MRAALAICILLAASALAVAGTHPHHVSIAEVEYKPDRSCLEIALRVWPADLEKSLRLRTGKKVELEGDAPDKEISSYLEEVFQVRDRAGELRPIRWVGKEIDLKHAWLYFEVPIGGGLDGASLYNGIFFEHLADQENTLNLRQGSFKSTLRFRLESKPATVSVDQTRAEVFFHRDVEPLLQRHCQGCHHEGGAAPFTLMDFEGVRGWAPMIAETVAIRRMPPWHADPSVGEFANDRRLKSNEIDTFVRWVQDGAPRGDPAAAPPARVFETGWQIGEPDAVLSTQLFEVPAEGVLPYSYVRVKTNFDTDRWVKAAQVRSTGSTVVHHVLVFTASLPSPRQEPGRPWSPRINPSTILRDIPADRRKVIMPRLMRYAMDFQQGNGGGLFGYFLSALPGDGPTVFPEGQARLLERGAVLIFQIHYTPNGEVQESQTSLALRFADAPPERATEVHAASTVALEIPPGQADYRVETAFTFPRGATLTSLRPHMHLRGKAVRYFAEYPDGTEELLLHVPNFDFNWQSEYVFANPRHVPEGTVLRVKAVFDNSDENPLNPDPTQTVYFGLQTWEEMLIGYFEATWDQE